MSSPPFQLVRRARGRTWRLIAYSLWAWTTVILGASIAAAAEAPGPDLNQPVLRSVGEIFSLRDQEPKNQIQHPVDMEVHVAYFDPLWNLIYFESDAWAPNFSVGGLRESIEMGDVVRLEGALRPVGPYTLTDFKVTRLERKRPFQPLVIDGNLSEVLRLEQRMVQCSALVERQFETDPTHLELHLIIEGQKIRGRLLLQPNAPVPELAGQLVALSGVLVPNRNAAPEFLGELWVGSVDAVTPLGPLMDHALFDLPETKIADLPNVPAGTVVKVEGIVDVLSSGRDLRIIQPRKDNPVPDRLRISSAQTLHVDVGQPVEVCGVPVRTARGWRLERPMIRPIKGATAQLGETVTASAQAPAATEVLTQTNNQPVPPEDLPVITSLQDLWDTDTTRKNWLHRMDMVIHVSYCDPGWSVLWAENGPSASFWDVVRKDIDLRTGQMVRLKGLVRPSDRLSITSDISIETNGLPAYVPFTPIPVDGNLTEPSLNSRVVRLTGLVEQQTELDQFHNTFALIVDGYKITTHARLYETERIPNYVGHLVTIEGLYVPQGGLSKDPGQFTGDLWVGQVSTIRSVATLAEDARFNIAPSSIEELADPNLDRTKEVRVIGHVRTFTPGESVQIRDETGLITIKTAQTIQIPRSGRVEVRGYPTIIEGQPSLLRPLFRQPIGTEATTAPKAASIRRTYRIAEDIMRLRPEIAAEKHAVRLNAVVTWSHPEKPFFFVSDASGSTQVMRRPDDTSAPPSAGSLVNLTGSTARGVYAPFVQLDSLSVIGNWNLTEPPQIPIEQVWTGAEEAQRVRVTGFVRSISHDGGWGHLDLISPGGQSVRASLADTAILGQFSHAIVSVTGVAQAQTTADGRLDQPVIWLNSEFDIREIESTRADPFETPLEPIAVLEQFSGQRQARNIIHVRGTVLALPSPTEIVIHDGTDGVIVITASTLGTRAGDTVDVVGLIGTSGPRTVIREARFRVIERIGDVTPRIVNRTPLLDPSRDCELVRIKGKVVDRSWVNERLRINLVEGVEFFEASLTAPSISPEMLDNCRPGSVLELTGAYLIGYNEEHSAARFGLHLRSEADITPLLLPSKFTATHAKWLAAGLTVTVALAFAWVYSLRRRVKHQTGQIREQLVKEARLEDRQRNIIEKASDFIFMLDLSGNFTLFNPAGEAMTGYTREDVPRLTIYDLIDENDRIGLRTALLKARPGSEIQPFQSQFRRKDGTLIWAEVAIRFLVEDDRVTGALCVARDITERKRVEEELKRARDAAEANTRAKSAFLANMSHEIRTPMNGVIGMSNLLLDTSLNHDQRDFALTIRNSAEALLTVLNDILDFSKIEAGKLQFETLDFDLTETVDDTLDLLAARAASKHLELAALIPTTLPQKLRGDPGRLRQVLLNLIGNAIKFTENGDVSVSVSLDRETRTGYLMRFEVRDTGIGISQEQQERLFMPFSQADASTTRRYGGTGLGLAICRQIIEQMNGQIGVRSEPGRGSTFWFTLELGRGSEAPLTPTPGALRGQRVLGVDDNQINRVVLQHYLEPSGARLDLAADAHEALGMLRAAATAGDPFRLVLLDFHMPEMDGLSLARAIHADPRLHGLPMALLTSVDRRFTPEELAAIGINASMAKPIRQRELMHTIQRALHPEATAHPAAPQVASDRVASMPPLRVLIAEDNPVNQRLTRIQLKKLGYEADLACNGLEVLEAFERVSYDVIFMDCQMPELDGYETARRLATHSRRSEVRIVAMTANAMQGDRDKCLESGMDDYLSKPTRPDELAAALRRAAEAVTPPV